MLLAFSFSLSVCPRTKFVSGQLEKERESFCVKITWSAQVFTPNPPSLQRAAINSVLVRLLTNCSSLLNTNDMMKTVVSSIFVTASEGNKEEGSKCRFILIIIFNKQDTPIRPTKNQKTCGSNEKRKKHNIGKLAGWETRLEMEYNHYSNLHILGNVFWLLLCNLFIT